MIVLDVNAAIAIAKGTEEGRVLRELMMEGEEVVAPHFFLTELGNVVWQIVRAGELDEEDFPVLFERAAGFVDRFVPAEGILLEAIHAAIQNNHPVYDMLYFIVTRRNAATLFTFDKKLRAVCEANGVNCLGTARPCRGRFWRESQERTDASGHSFPGPLTSRCQISGNRPKNGKIHKSRMFRCAA